MVRNCSSNKILFGNGLFVLVNELLGEIVIAISNLDSTFIRTSRTDTNNNRSLAEKLNCVL